MGLDVDTLELKLIRRADSVEFDLLPLQGSWTEEQYLKLSSQTNHLIEFTDGALEVLPMPTRDHQVILAFLYEVLLLLFRPRGGKVLFAPLRLQVCPGKYRESDLLALLHAQDPRNQNYAWLGADLVIEIVDPDRPERDTVSPAPQLRLQPSRAGHRGWLPPARRGSRPAPALRRQCYP